MKIQDDLKKATLQLTFLNNPTFTDFYEQHRSTTSHLYKVFTVGLVSKVRMLYLLKVKLGNIGLMATVK